MHSGRSTPNLRSIPARALSPLALTALLACGAPEGTSTPEPRRGRETDDAAEWAAARRTEENEVADAAQLDDGATVEQEGPSEQFPCTVADQQQVEELLGNTVEAPAWTLEEVTEDNQAFRAATCGWLTFTVDANEIVLQVSRGEHFDDGTVVCWSPGEAAREPVDEPAGDAPDAAGEGDEEGAAVDAEEPPAEPTPVAIADLGSAAWWLYDPLTAFGQLQVCHPRARIALEVNAADGTQARRAAVDLARRTIGGLDDST